MVRATATDAAGNARTATTTLAIDAPPPFLELTGGDQLTNDGTPTIAFDVASGVGVTVSATRGAVTLDAAVAMAPPTLLAPVDAGLGSTGAMALDAQGNVFTCNGLGTIQGVNEKNEVVPVTCTTCKGLKSERLVNFR